MPSLTFSGISVATVGPALGHGMLVDETTLSQALASGQSREPVKVFTDHIESIDSLIGLLRNFRIEGEQLRADLELLEAHPKAAFYAEILDKAPDQLGFSMAFAGAPDEVEGKLYARVRELISVDLVTRPAANPDGVFRAPAFDTGERGMASADNSAPAPQTAPEAVVEENQFSVESDVADLKTAVAEIQAAVAEIKAALMPSEDMSEDKKDEPTEMAALAAKVADLEVKLSAVSAAPVATAGPAADDPVEQFKAASEAKDWKLCAELYAKHSDAIWRSRRN